MGTPYYVLVELRFYLSIDSIVSKDKYSNKTDK